MVKKGVPTGYARGHEVQGRHKREAQLKVLSLLASGMNVKEACAEAKRDRGAYYGWRREDPLFLEKSDLAVAQGRKRSVAEARRLHLVSTSLKGSNDKVVREDFNNFASFFVEFRRVYFGMETYPHQQLIVDAMERAGPGSTTMVLIPPEWGKTTLLEDYACARLCANPNTRIALVSEGQDLAMKSMNRIQSRLDDEEDGDASMLMAHYGPFKPPPFIKNKPWNMSAITIMGSTWDERDPSVATAGIKSRIRGARWDEVVLDDIQSIVSLGETHRFVDIYRNDIVTRPGVEGRKFIIGSRVGRNDFYEAMLDLDLIDEFVKIPALNLDKPEGEQSNFPQQQGVGGIPLLAENGRTIGWTDEQLAKRRKEVGEDAWSRVYMQEPQSRAGALITEQELLDSCNKNRSVGQLAGIGIIASLDPALVGHAAYTVCGYDANRLYVLDVVDFEAPGRNEAVLAEIDRLTARFNPSYWVIENNHLQSGYLVDDRFLDMRDRYGFHAISHHTGTEKRDPMLGIPAMMNAIMHGEIEFPFFGAEPYPPLASLFDQLLAWRSDIPTRMLIQDQVMSLWFCFTLWRTLRERIAPDTTMWRRPALRRPTVYPYATQNVELAGADPALAPAPKTYEQQWAELVALR